MALNTISKDNPAQEGWRSADHWIFLAVSDKGGGYAFADREQVSAGISWSLYASSERKLLAGGLPSADGNWNEIVGGKPLSAYSGSIIVVGACQALARVPEGGAAHLFQDASSFYAPLNYGRLGRIASGYRRASGNKALANQEAWVELDAIIAGRQLRSVTGGPPPNAALALDPTSIEWWIRKKFEDEKDSAKSGLRDYGQPHSERGL